MSESSAFLSLMQRLRAGDSAAAEELVREFEPRVRGAARGRLDSLKLRRLLDSTDISQVVLSNFLRRAASGQFELEDASQLVALLVTMARNQVLDEARKARAQVRDQRRQADQSDHCLDGLLSSGPTPSRVVAVQELTAQLCEALPPDLYRLLERRAAGDEWSALAAEFGSTPAALRKKLARALQRVVRDLDLGEES